VSDEVASTLHHSKHDVAMWDAIREFVLLLQVSMVLT
jgi:hypothetical protein